VQCIADDDRLLRLEDLRDDRVRDLPLGVEDRLALHVACDLDLEIPALDENQEPFVGARQLDDLVHQRLEELGHLVVGRQLAAELVDLAIGVDLVGAHFRIFGVGLVVEQERRVHIAEGQLVAVAQRGLLLLLAVDEELTLSTRHRDVESLAVELDQRMRIPDVVAVEPDVVLVARTDARDLLVQRVRATLPIIGPDDQARHGPLSCSIRDWVWSSRRLYGAALCSDRASRRTRKSAWTRRVARSRPHRARSAARRQAERQAAGTSPTVTTTRLPRDSSLCVASPSHRVIDARDRACPSPPARLARRHAWRWGFGGDRQDEASASRAPPETSATCHACV